MADESLDGQEKTEEPTEERREKFRERGDVAHSREITSVFVFASSIFVMGITLIKIYQELSLLLRRSFSQIADVRIQSGDFLFFIEKIWIQFVSLIAPLFLVAGGVAIFATLLQTKFNFSWDKLTPNFSRLNILSGFKKIFSSQSVMELFKGLLKLFAILSVSYLVVFSEITKAPFILSLGVKDAWSYWAKTTEQLFWTISCLMLLIAGLDYFQVYRKLEQSMRMSKQEIKEDYKQREQDPLIKSRMRKMQRTLAFRKTMEATKEATVIITNPTHISIALKYELGMRAPIVLAKGTDFVALRMREIAKENNIPMVENKPVARMIYKVVKVNHEIPEKLYKAVSEIIRYVFKIKGMSVGGRA